jgi:hypothetical protein
MLLSIHDSTTHIISKLPENANTMLWRTEIDYIPYVTILSTILKLSDRDEVQTNDALQPPTQLLF